ncbi:hypothetical protein [Varibaculum sp.]|uniref:hypothetical protein n=4 Tax=Varibaculum sp. TaxID=1895474 RepID=UPI0025CE1536|nr:hypothetical protein [Varibaculum sp.]
MSSENESKPKNLNEANSSAKPGENLDSQEPQASTESLEPGSLKQENQSESHASSANTEVTEELPAPELPAPLPMGSEIQAAQGVATGSISGNEDESTVAATERTLTQESFNPVNLKVEKGKKSGRIARSFQKTWVKVVSVVGAAIIVFLSGLGVGMAIHSGGGHPHMPPGQGRQMAPGEQMDRQMRPGEKMRPGGSNRQLPPEESNQNGQNPRNLDNQNQNGNNQNDSQQQSGNNQSPQNGEKPGE